MKEQLAQLQHKWRQLDGRERRLVSILAVFVVIALFYFALWSPLQNGVTDARARVENQQNNLAWMQQSANQILASAGNKSSASSSARTSLTQRVNRAAARNKIKISRLQQQRDELNVRLDEEITFNALLTWLDQLEQEGVVASSLDLNKSDRPGFVDVRKLMLKEAS